jgi:MFS family permease
MRFWGAQTISLAGAEVTLLALPLTAILVLNATPFQLGILGASTFLPFLLFSLIAGAIADRAPRVRLMVLCDLVRAGSLALIPLAAAAGLLRIELLYVVAFIVGICTVFFALAYQSAIPDVAGRANLVDGNAKLETTRSLTQILGPSLAGALVQLLTAPIAIAVDVFSFVVSATLLRPLLRGEQAHRAAVRRSLLQEIGEGLRWVYGERRLRTLALSTTTYNFSTNMATTMYLLMATRQLGLEPLTIGVIASFGGPAVVLGALATPWITRRIGMGRTLIVANATSGLAFVIMGLAGGLPAGVAAVVLAAAQALNGSTLAPFNVNQLSFRQSITPAHLLGRTNATMRFTNFGAISIGALVGGALGTGLGPQAVVIVGGSLAMLGSLWLIASPLRTQATVGEPVREPATAT